MPTITNNHRHTSKANAINQEEIHYLISKRKITNYKNNWSKNSSEDQISLHGRSELDAENDSSDAGWY